MSALRLNGHEWAKRQCEKAGIGETALDNGFADCTDPKRLQRICDRLGLGAVKTPLKPKVDLTGNFVTGKRS